jgi:hypothetical protein
MLHSSNRASHQIPYAPTSITASHTPTCIYILHRQHLTWIAAGSSRYHDGGCSRRPADNTRGVLIITMDIESIERGLVVVLVLRAVDSIANI